MATNTRLAYEGGWKCFSDWCSERQVDPLKEKNKEALISFFLSDMAMKGDYKISTLSLYTVGIRWIYACNGIHIDINDSVLSKVLKGIKRYLGCRPDRKNPLLTNDIRTMVKELDTSKPIGIRDRALLVLGFAGAFRRSELVALNIEDLREEPSGYIVLVRKSKTDQDGEGMLKAIPYGSDINTCPVRSIKALLSLYNRNTGPLFTHIKKGDNITENRLLPQVVAMVIKRNYAIIDEPAFAGHSLRSGFVTSAAKNGVAIHEIMAQTGHKNVEKLMVYIRDATRLENCAASRVGL
jgi:integrase